MLHPLIPLFTTPVEIALTVSAVADLYESSYDRKAADEATSEQNKKVAELEQQGNKPAARYLPRVDYRKFYPMSIYEVCNKVNPALTPLVGYWLHSDWNGSLAWAKDVLFDCLTLKRGPIPLVMTPMSGESPEGPFTGYYVVSSDLYCDIEKQKDTWSIFFRDKNTQREAYSEYSLPMKEKVS